MARTIHLSDIVDELEKRFIPEGYVKLSSDPFGWIVTVDHGLQLKLQGLGDFDTMTYMSFKTLEEVLSWAKGLPKMTADDHRD